MFKRKPKYPELYPEDFSADLEAKLDWILKSNAAVQIGFDSASLRDYPKLKSDLIRLINEEKQHV